MENIELSNALYGVNRWNDIKELFVSDFKKCRTNDDINKLYNKYIPYIWFGRALNTVIKKYTEFRALISEINNKHSKYALEIVFLMGETNINKKPFNQGIYGVTIHKAKDKQLNKTTNDLKEIDLKVVHNLVHKLKDKIDNNDFIIASSQSIERVKAYHLIILLALTTGRRQVELLKTLEIDYNKNRKQKIYFKGIVKKGSKSIDKEAGTILFITIQETKKYLNMLRKLLPTQKMENIKINQKYNGVIASALIRYTKDIIGFKLKFHDLRSLYAEYAWETLGEGYTNKATFFDMVLNHKVEPTTADNYFKFKNKRISKTLDDSISQL
jgi:integrase